MSDFEDEDDINMDNINIDDEDEDGDEATSDYPDIQIKFDENGFPVSPPPMEVNKNGEMSVARVNRRRPQRIEEEVVSKVGLSLMPENNSTKSLGIDLFLANFKMVGTDITCEHKTSIPLPEANLLKSLLKESNFTSEDWIAYIKKALDVDKLAVEIYNALVEERN